MKKLLALAAAFALAGVAAAQTSNTSNGGSTAGTASGAQTTQNTGSQTGTTGTTTTTTGTGTAQQTSTGTTTTPVFTTNSGGTLTDQRGNTLTQTSTGQFTDRSGTIYTVDGNGRLIDPNGNVVSAPGVVINTGQSSFSGVAPSLPGQTNQPITLGPQTTTTTTAATAAGANATGTGAAPFSSTTLQNQNLALTPGLAAQNPANGVSVGANSIVSGRVVAYEPGRTITIQQQNGLNVTFPLSASTVLPANLGSQGGSVTLYTNTDANGIPQVTRVATGTLTSQPTTTGRFAPTTTTGGGTIQTASGARATVGGTRRTGTITRDVVYTVQSFNGNTLVVRTPTGTTRTLRVTNSSSIPSDLAAGRQVVISTGAQNTVGTVSYYPVLSRRS